MRSYQLGKNKYIVKYKGDFYIVNKYTKEIITSLEKCETIEDFSNAKNLSFNKAEKMLMNFQNALENVKFYKPNLHLPSPMKLQWKITNKCNLRCKHCYLGDLNQVCLDEIDLFEIADKIINSSVTDITITGGEALTVPCLDKIVEKLIKNDISVKVFTNGTLLVNFLDKIKDLKNIKDYLSFNVSLDGTEEIHNSIRGAGTFSKTIEGIKAIIDLGCSLSINCVISKINYKCIAELVELLCQLKVKNIQLSNIIILGNADKKMKLSADEMKEIQKNVKIVSQKYNLNLLYGNSDEDFEDIYYDKNGNAIGKENWQCCAGMTRATIDYNGDVFCCPFCSQFKLGNILDSSLNDIWRNENRYKFLSYLSNYKNKKSRMCIMTQKNNF